MSRAVLVLVQGLIKGILWLGDAVSLGMGKGGQFGRARCDVAP